MTWKARVRNFLDSTPISRSESESESTHKSTHFWLQFDSIWLNFDSRKVHKKLQKSIKKYALTPLRTKWLHLAPLWLRLTRFWLHFDSIERVLWTYEAYQENIHKTQATGRRLPRVSQMSPNLGVVEVVAQAGASLGGRQKRRIVYRKDGRTKDGKTRAPSWAPRFWVCYWVFLFFRCLTVFLLWIWRFVHSRFGSCLPWRWSLSVHSTDTVWLFQYHPLSERWLCLRSFQTVWRHVLALGFLAPWPSD